MRRPWVAWIHVCSCTLQTCDCFIFISLSWLACKAQISKIITMPLVCTGYVQTSAVFRAADCVLTQRVAAATGELQEPRATGEVGVKRLVHIGLGCLRI